MSIVGDEILIEITNESWRHHHIVHRRKCTVHTAGASVVDEIRGNPTFGAPVNLHWLVEDGSEVKVTCSEGGTLSDVRGDRESTRGWTAESYGAKRPVRSIRLTVVPRAGQVRTVSSFGTTPAASERRAAVTPEAEAPCST